MRTPWTLHSDFNQSALSLPTPQVYSRLQTFARPCPLSGVLVAQMVTPWASSHFSGPSSHNTFSEKPSLTTLLKHHLSPLSITFLVDWGVGFPLHHTGTDSKGVLGRIFFQRFLMFLRMSLLIKEKSSFV